MADKRRYSVGLTIGHGGKGIPYGGHGDVRPDGTANHGFKYLKGELDRLSEVPELKEDPNLYDLVYAINRSETGLLSVGCGYWPVEDDRGHRVEGYIEFAINSAEAIEDARAYFPLFFKFDQMLHQAKFDEPVNYHWELEGANFSRSQADGFTASVWIRTAYEPTLDASRGLWERAIEPLTHFLGGFPPQEGRPLIEYALGTE